MIDVSTLRIGNYYQYDRSEKTFKVKDINTCDQSGGDHGYIITDEKNTVPISSIESIKLCDEILNRVCSNFDNVYYYFKANGKVARIRFDFDDEIAFYQEGINDAIEFKHLNELQDFLRLYSKQELIIKE